MTDSLTAALAARLEQLGPARPGARFLVAFSGGLDSTALIHLMAGLIPPDLLGAAHLNHNLRGPAAEADQAFARRTAESLGLAFITETRDVALLARERRKGVEEAARRARYDFLARAAEEFGADYLLTAHQADDQAETMLMHFLKGSGGGGLAGIPPRRTLKRGSFEVELIRPLLPFNRAELQSWLETRSLPWVEDRSNLDEHYRRNALRLDIIPRLKKFNPRLERALGRAAEIMRAEEDFWRGHLAGLWPLLAREEAPDLIKLERASLARLSLAERRRLIYEALKRLRRNRVHSGEPLSLASVETVLAIMNETSHKGLDLPGGLRAEVDPVWLRLSPASRFLAARGGPE